MFHCLWNSLSLARKKKKKMKNKNMGNGVLNLISKFDIFGAVCSSLNATRSMTVFSVES